MAWLVRVPLLFLRARAASQVRLLQGQMVHEEAHPLATSKWLDQELRLRTPSDRSCRRSCSVPVKCHRAVAEAEAEAVDLIQSDIKDRTDHEGPQLVQLHPLENTRLSPVRIRATNARDNLA